MKARYQYRIYPTDQQRQSLARLFGCVRVAWNDALSLCKKSVSVSEARPLGLAGERTRSTKLPSNGDLQKSVSGTLSGIGSKKSDEALALAVG